MILGEDVSPDVLALPFSEHIWNASRNNAMLTGMAVSGFSFPSIFKALLRVRDVRGDDLPLWADESSLSLELGDLPQESGNVCSQKQ